VEEPEHVIRRVRIDSLHLDPANARAHGPDNLQALLEDAGTTFEEAKAERKEKPVADGTTS